MVHLLLFVVVLAELQSAGEEGVRIEPVPPAPPGQDQYIAFTAAAPWMEGHVRIRFPESIHSQHGLHFLDNVAPELPRVSNVGAPEWEKDDGGRLSYTATTDDGMTFAGAAWVDGEAVEMAFSVTNNTGAALDISAQVCIDMSTSPTFSERDRLDTTYAWFDGAYRSLTEATAAKPRYEETGFRWVLMLFKDDPDEGVRAAEGEFPWWILDQQADRPIIVRETHDGRHLIAVTWDRTVRRLMANTNIPCMHADPLHCENLANGDTHAWRGRLFLMENDPEALLRRNEAPADP